MTSSVITVSDVVGFVLFSSSCVELGGVEAATDVLGMSVDTNSSVVPETAVMDSVLGKAVVAMSPVLGTTLGVLDTAACVGSSGVWLDISNVLKSPVTGTEVSDSAVEGLADDETSCVVAATVSTTSSLVGVKGGVTCPVLVSYEDVSDTVDGIGVVKGFSAVADLLVLSSVVKGIAEVVSWPVKPSTAVTPSSMVGRL